MKVCPECDRQYGDDVEFCAHDGSKLRTSEESSGDPLIGRMLDGRWRIEEKIGEGGMGAIYLASQESVGREVAVKTLRTALSENEEFAERFMREARVTSSIHHPHCVTIFDFGQTENNTLYLAMEYLEGEPLADRMEREPMSVRTALEVGIQVASALSAAHQRDVIHRDLKPDNVFLLDITDGSTFTKVLDFGISKDLGSDDDLTQTGQVFGTPQYMSPEQARGDELDARSDLYSLGCILYEMTAGRPPFDGEKSMEVLVAHVQQEVPPVSSVSNRDVPDRLADVVMGLLAKPREARPSRAGEVRSSLETLFEDLVGSDTGPRAGNTSADTSAAAAGHSDTSPGEGELARASTLRPGGDDDRDQGDGTEPGLGPSPTETVGNGSTESRRASAPDRDTHPQQSESWIDRNRGLVVGLVGLMVVGAALVVAGGGYLAYRSASNGSGPLALWGGSEKSAGGESASDDGSGDDGESAPAVEASADATAPPDDRSTDDAGNAGTDTAGDDIEESIEETGAEQQVAAAEAGGAPAESGERDRGGGSDGARAEESSGDAEERAVGAPGNEGSENGKGNDDEENVAEAEEGSDPADGAAPAEPPDDRNVDESSGEAEGASAEPEPSESQRESETGSGVHSADLVRRTDLSATGAACNKADVQRRLRAVESQLGKCHDQASGSGGSLMLEWTISTEGKPLEVAPLRSDVGSALESCAVRTVDVLEFAPPSGGRCYTRATFEFGE